MLPLLVAAACASTFATLREAARDARAAREATEDVLALALDVNEGDVARAVEADARARERRERRATVSYTHLTLPTILLV